MVYQFVSRNTVEEGILERSKGKLVLGHVVVDVTAVDQNELNSILRIGAQKLFEEAGDDAIIYDDEAVEKLLDRNQESTIDRGDYVNDELLGKFNLAQVC